MKNHPIEKWHQIMQSDNNDGLWDILDENAVFSSPVVHTPQAGREKTFAYLSAASQTFSNSQFEYVRKIIDGNQAMLEFTAKIDGIIINGVDIITFNDAEKIIDFKVMVRPLKAINMLWQKMGEQLQAQQESA